MIYRDVSKQLDRWKGLENHRPLLLRGARQVGKSTLIETWGTKNFSNFVMINFEQNPEYSDAFDSLDPQKIIQTLSLISSKSIIPGECLLFLDEIQECPRAVTALRYFFEQCPQLHVIGAGSSLEMALKAGNLKIPVGRVESLNLFPLSFGEFLHALGEADLRTHLKNVGLKEKIPEAIHTKLLERVSFYYYLGGMPAVVQEYITNNEILRAKELKNSIIFTYRRDFGKYSSLVNLRYLEAVFRSAPRQVGGKIVYQHIDSECKPSNLKSAIELLTDVQVFHRIFKSHASGLPLMAGINEKFYKLILLDIGLLQRLSGIESSIIKADNLLDVYRGALAEQFVGQELLVVLNEKKEEPQLTYWARESRNSSAEVDYLWVSGSHIFPIEVKAGHTGSLKSLHLFVQSHASPFGIRVSSRPLSFENNVLSIPLYLTDQIDRFIDEALKL